MNFSLLFLVALFTTLSGTRLALAQLTSLSTTTSNNNVVRPAPDFSWQQRNGTIAHLSSLRGKPVLLLIASSPRDRVFLHQLRELQAIYEKVAAEGLICCAAFTEETGRVPSNIPFITALHGAQTATAYGLLQKNHSMRFALAMISRDGNLDDISTKVLAGERIADLIDASYTTQEALRKP